MQPLSGSIFLTINKAQATHAEFAPDYAILVEAKAGTAPAQKVSVGSTERLVGRTCLSY